MRPERPIRAEQWDLLAENATWAYGRANRREVLTLAPLSAWTEDTATSHSASTRVAEVVVDLGAYRELEALDVDYRCAGEVQIKALTTGASVLSTTTISETGGTANGTTTISAPGSGNQSILLQVSLIKSTVNGSLEYLRIKTQALESDNFPGAPAPSTLLGLATAAGATEVFDFEPTRNGGLDGAIAGWTLTQSGGTLGTTTIPGCVGQYLTSGTSQYLTNSSSGLDFSADCAVEVAFKLGDPFSPPASGRYSVVAIYNSGGGVGFGVLQLDADAATDTWALDRNASSASRVSSLRVSNMSSGDAGTIIYCHWSYDSSAGQLTTRFKFGSESLVTDTQSVSSSSDLSSTNYRIGQALALLGAANPVAIGHVAEYPSTLDASHAASALAILGL